MSKNFLKFTFQTALIICSFSLASCGMLKPAHPQKKFSFKERKPPRENLLAAAGAFGKKDEDKNSTNFQPIDFSKISIEDNNHSSSSSSTGLTKSVSEKISKQYDSFSTQQDDSSSSSSGSGSDSSINDFIKSIFSPKAEGKSLGLSVNYKIATSVTKKSQGDTEHKVSFFDIADQIPLVEIIPTDDYTYNSLSTSENKINDGYFKLAANVTIPHVPTEEELKEESYQLDEPELKDVPGIPAKSKSPNQK